MKSLSDLTADDVRRLPAGEELDRLVAEAIRGRWWMDALYTRHPAEYSTCLGHEATKAMAEKLGKGWLWSLDYEGTGYRFTWLLPTPDGCTGHPFGPSAEGETEDLARCRAVLLAWSATEGEVPK